MIFHLVGRSRSLGASTCVTGLILATLVAGACTSSATPDAPSTARPGPPRTAIEEIVADLWVQRVGAIWRRSTDDLATIEDDPALAGDRFYWMEFCPGLCPDPTPPPEDPPGVKILAVDNRGAAAVALVTSTSRWPVGEENPIEALLRIDEDESEGWQITVVDEWIATGELPSPPTGVLGPLEDTGLDLSEEYLDVRDIMAAEQSYPEDAPFAPGPWTDGYLDALSGHRRPEPWEVRTLERRPAPEHLKVSFTIAGDDGRRLHCALHEETETVRHAEGETLRPIEVLGSLAHLIEDGLYSSFTVTDVVLVCILEPREGDPVVYANDWSRAEVSGTKS